MHYKQTGNQIKGVLRKSLIALDVSTDYLVAPFSHQDAVDDLGGTLIQAREDRTIYVLPTKEGSF